MVGRFLQLALPNIWWVPWVPKTLKKLGFSLENRGYSVWKWWFWGQRVSIAIGVTTPRNVTIIFSIGKQASILGHQKSMINAQHSLTLFGLTRFQLMLQVVINVKCVHLYIAWAMGNDMPQLHCRKQTYWLPITSTMLQQEQAHASVRARGTHTNFRYIFFTPSFQSSFSLSNWMHPRFSMI